MNLKFLCKNILGMQDWGDVHDELRKFLEAPGNRKHIELPRGHLKSSIVTKGWSIQQALRNPDIRILLANSTWDNSRKFLRSIQKYLGKGNILSQLFGVFESDHWNQDECTIRFRKKILDAPTWATTGLEKEQTSQHYDLIIADDIVSRENIGTKEQREKVKLYYKDLLDLLEPDGRLVVIGTRWHQDDLYAELLADPGFKTFVRMAYQDESRTEVIYPQKFNLEYLSSLRSSKGAYEFAAQYLNNPIDGDTADFKREWLRYYDPATPNPATLYCTVDPGASLSTDADPSAIMVAGQFGDRRIRIVDYKFGRWPPDVLVDTIFKVVSEFHLHRVGIETFAYQKTLKYEILRQQRERQIYFSVDELRLRHSGAEGKAQYVNKEMRIRRLQPFFEQGLIEMRSDMRELQDELLAFPRGKHDDLLDALASQLDHLIPSLNQSAREDETKVRPFQLSMRQVINSVTNKGSKTIVEQIMQDIKRPTIGIPARKAA